MAENPSGTSKGLLNSLTKLAATLVAIAHTRLELLSTELEEGREHLFSLLLLAIVALFCFGVGVLPASMLLVAVFWDTHRLLVLAALTGFFLAAGITAWGIAMHKARTKPKIFAVSLSELRKDRQQLISRL